MKKRLPIVNKTSEQFKQKSFQNEILANLNFQPGTIENAVKAAINGNGCCPICLMTCIDIKLLPCQHLFHKHCLTRFFQEKKASKPKQPASMIRRKKSHSKKDQDDDEVEEDGENDSTDQAKSKCCPICLILIQDYQFLSTAAPNQFLHQQQQHTMMMMPVVSSSSSSIPHLIGGNGMMMMTQQHHQQQQQQLQQQQIRQSSSSNSGNSGSSNINQQRLRKGKWTMEESTYCDRLILEFKKGTLPLAEGTTLRTFLSRLLNCDPMRISKKYTGEQCIGKIVFRRRPGGELSKEDSERIRSELGELEAIYIERERSNQQRKEKRLANHGLNLPMASNHPNNTIHPTSNCSSFTYGPSITRNLIPTTPSSAVSTSSGTSSSNSNNSKNSTDRFEQHPSYMKTNPSAKSMVMTSTINTHPTPNRTTTTTSNSNSIPRIPSVDSFSSLFPIDNVYNNNTSSSSNTSTTNSSSTSNSNTSSGLSHSNSSLNLFHSSPSMENMLENYIQHTSNSNSATTSTIPRTNSLQELSNIIHFVTQENSSNSLKLSTTNNSATSKPNGGFATNNYSNDQEGPEIAKFNTKKSSSNEENDIPVPLKFTMKPSSSIKSTEAEEDGERGGIRRVPSMEKMLTRLSPPPPSSVPSAEVEPFLKPTNSFTNLSSLMRVSSFDRFLNCSGDSSTNLFELHQAALKKEGKSNSPLPSTSLSNGSGMSRVSSMEDILALMSSSTSTNDPVSRNKRKEPETKNDNPYFSSKKHCYLK